MTMRLRDLWSWTGDIGRADYARWGCYLMALKFLIDWLISTTYARPWSPLFYISPGRGLETLGTGESYHLVMLLFSIPFLWTGVMLTTRRLRSAGLSPIWTFLFMVPLINLAFFLILMRLPKATATRRIDTDVRPVERFIPSDSRSAAVVATLISIPFALVFVILGTQVFDAYGWSLFVLVPFFIGQVSAFIWGYHSEKSVPSTLCVCTLSCLAAGTALLGFQIEGIVCLAMALPAALPTAFLGAMIGKLLTRPSHRISWKPQVVVAPLFFLPAVMGFENTALPEPPLVAVSTTIEIHAPVETVWPNVVGFSEIGDPEEWIFRAGIAAPVRAEIVGSGVGAIRRCEFTTGAFIEPIEKWEENELLAFSVVKNPPTMREWSLFGEIDAAHLEGNFVAVRGEFRLEKLPGGGTRLIGTTWYRQHLRPHFYWRLWTDQIVHAIHERVLQHIRRLSEG